MIENLSSVWMAGAGLVMIGNRNNSGKGGKKKRIHEIDPSLRYSKSADRVKSERPQPHKMWRL